MKYFLVTLGCTKNEFDSSSMESRLLQNGFSPVRSLEEADVIILNTCSFIEEAIEESKEMASFLERNRRKGTKLIITGCAVNYFGKEAGEELPQGDVFIPINEQLSIPEILKSGPGRKKKSISKNKIRPQSIFENYRTSQDGRTAVILKVAEGCLNFCHYCAIPLIRGTLKSFPLDEIIKEAERLLKSGTKELILVAQDLASYGKDLFPHKDLSLLVKRLSEISSLIAGENFWIRLLYMNPDNLSEKTIKEIFDIPGVVPYFDIPVQTGSDRLRKQMGRRKSLDDIYEMLKSIRKRYEEAHLRTSFLVGFPGEEDKDIEATIELVRDIEFDYAAVFKYSKMPGTKASELRKQISEEEKIARLTEVKKAVDEISGLRAIERENLDVKMLLESRENGYICGRYFGQAPEIDGNVYLPEDRVKALPGDFKMVKLVESCGFDYIAEVI